MVLIDLGFHSRDKKQTYHIILCTGCKTEHRRRKNRLWTICRVCKPGNWKHGHDTRGNRSSTLSSWASMKARCNGSTLDPNYVNISYDPNWENFSNFLKDMGERPKGTTLDRIDVYGDYSKSNCRWADYKTQANNKRNTVYWTWGGVKLPMVAWVDILETTYLTLKKRMYTRGTFFRRFDA